MIADIKANNKHRDTEYTTRIERNSSLQQPCQFWQFQLSVVEMQADGKDLKCLAHKEVVFLSAQGKGQVRDECKKFAIELDICCTNFNKNVKLVNFFFFF